MLNYILLIYENYNYIYYGVTLYYSLVASYNTYYYCKFFYSYIPSIKYQEIEIEEINDINVVNIKKIDLE